MKGIADDNDTAWITADIIAQTGFVPIRVGALAHSAPIDPGGPLFPGLLGLFSPQDMQTTLDKGAVHPLAPTVSDNAVTASPQSRAH
jgi:hypothetical protein